MSTHTFIAAEAGFRVVAIELPDASAAPIYTWSRVLAWRIAQDGAVIPVTLPAMTLGARSAIVLPASGGQWAGPCVSSDGRAFTSLELFVDELRDAIRESAEATKSGRSRPVGAESAGVGERSLAEPSRVGLGNPAGRQLGGTLNHTPLVNPC